MDRHVYGILCLIILTIAVVCLAEDVPVGGSPTMSRLVKRQYGAYGAGYPPPPSPYGRGAMYCAPVSKTCTFSTNYSCHRHCIKRGFLSGHCNTKYLPDRCDCCRPI
ncbi:uncharacterized protein LOC129598173 [Paramacrobiotus metropolitanus]|uniref:uncharacterized protein LOC129598173 n=1 Tax=Paramacrobiotus metropolitanus TaxID=2943436 RepID=UPI002445A2E8|nr:uncharacterized protein LOC129598173 [Paramacrobiotus metropolitanus]